jgi:hypothetical protein
MVEFKIGDRVKRIQGGHCGNMQVGDMGTVTKLDGYDMCLKEFTGNFDSVNYELVKTGNPGPVTHVVLWDDEYKDPHRICYNEQEAKDLIKELSEKNNVKKDSIVLVEVKSIKRVSVMKYLRYAKY